MDGQADIPWAGKRWVAWAILLGVYLSARGYHSRDGDQAYRLPLLLHRQDPALFAADPFVKALDAFNPHRGYLALLDATSRPFGLSAALAALFVLTFAATALGIDRLTRAAWPEQGSGVGVVAVGLLLVTKAGNLGTNHLFEAMLLDRLIGFGLGWVALASAVSGERGRAWVAPLAIGLAALIHPSIGLQLAMLAGGGWLLWALLPGWTGVDWRWAFARIAMLGMALVPAAIVYGGARQRMFVGLSREEFLLLGAYVQSPQHMLPHLWRRSQWFAWACLLALAGLSYPGGRRNDALSANPMGVVSSNPPFGASRVRLALLLGVNLLGLALAWAAVEGWQDLRVTLFQPFRMATIARGLALVFVAGRGHRLWNRGNAEGRSRAVLLAVGLTGDWSLVVVAAAELAATVAEGLRPAFGRWVGPSVLGIGLATLARHDTESGHWPLIGALGGLAAWGLVTRGRPFSRTPRRAFAAIGASWAVPLLALLAPLATDGEHGIGKVLIERCRFGETPVDDVERLGLWCRDHTPASARFVGPPGPKGFRLWSRREVAFNRAASPYHAEGLADWSARFRDHVGFSGTPTAFARSYLADRHGLEGRYEAFTDRQKAELARRQGATHVLAAPPPAGTELAPDGPLELLRVEGRYAVYRVREPRPPAPIQARTGSARSAGTG